MNKTKRNLILASGIMSLISAGLSIIMGIVFACCTELVLQVLYESFASSGYVDVSMLVRLVNMATFVMFIGAITYALAGGFLIGSVRNGGKKFNESKSLYTTGVVFTMLSGLLSIASILLYISMGMQNEQAVKSFTINTDQNGTVEQIAQKNDEPVKEDSKDKIDHLRKMKEEGLITQEEFNDQIMKLL